MKSRTLSSELTILKKDLTRFSPVWLLLCAWLILWGYDLSISEAAYRNSYEPIAPVFAPICALTLFGYLTKPSECSMVHSLPIRRERLFLLHVTAGFVMFVVPTAVFCGLTEPLLEQSFGYRLGWTVLEFGFLFSIGVFCMMLTGTKLGAGLLYLFIQTVTVIVGGILDVLYLPMLPGVYLDTSFMLLSPSLIIGSYADFIYDTRMEADSWAFAALFAVLTVVIFAISLVLYRKRKLEHAGDLLAVKWLDPFFAVCSGLTGIWVLGVFFGLYEDGQSWPTLLLGLAVGYFAYTMLSKRSTRVFTPKILAGFACLTAVVVSSVYITGLDPFDRVQYTPEPEEVASATLNEGYYGSIRYTTTDPVQIAAVEELHLDVLEEFLANEKLQEQPAHGSMLHITYKLKNGRTIHREYEIEDKQLLEQAAWYLSQPSARFGTDEPDIREMVVHHNGEVIHSPQQKQDEFLSIFFEECRQGRMFSFEYDNAPWMVVLFDETGGGNYITIPAKAVDTIAWLEENCQFDK